MTKIPKYQTQRGEFSVVSVWIGCSCLSLVLNGWTCVLYLDQIFLMSSAFIFFYAALVGTIKTYKGCRDFVFIGHNICLSWHIYLIDCDFHFISTLWYMLWVQVATILFNSIFELFLLKCVVSHQVSHHFTIYCNISTRIIFHSEIWCL